MYNNPQPATPETALAATNTALCTFTFSAAAFGALNFSGGNDQATAGFVATSVTPGASGTVTFARATIKSVAWAVSCYLRHAVHHRLEQRELLCADAYRNRCRLWRTFRNIHGRQRRRRRRELDVLLDDCHSEQRDPIQLTISDIIVVNAVTIPL